MKQELAASLSKRQKAQLVESDEVESREINRQRALPVRQHFSFGDDRREPGAAADTSARSQVSIFFVTRGQSAPHDDDLRFRIVIRNGMFQDTENVRDARETPFERFLNELALVQF